MKFSVIVPVYNVEKYLRRCIESIIGQSYSNLEIILVDDGSKDSSGLICDEYKLIDSRIIVIHKQNEGLGFARNTGMSVATGDYISFVDSDDYIVKDYFYKLVNIAMLNKPDIIAFGFQEVLDDGKIIEHKNFSSIKYSGIQIRDIILPRAFGPNSIREDDEYGIGPAWGAIYCRAFLLNNNILFKSEREILSEDIVFSIDLCLKANSIEYFDSCLYKYCQNNGSLSRSYRKDRFDRSLDLFNYMISIAKCNKLNKEAFTRINNNLISNVIVSLKQEFSVEKKYVEKRKMISVIVKNKDVQKVCKEVLRIKTNLTKKIVILCIRLKLVDLLSILIWIKVKNNG